MTDDNLMGIKEYLDGERDDSGSMQMPRAYQDDVERMMARELVDVYEILADMQHMINFILQRMIENGNSDLQDLH